MRRLLPPFLALSLLLLSGCCELFRFRPHSHYIPKASEGQIEDINYPAIVDTVFGYGTELRCTKKLTLCSSCALVDGKVDKLRLEFISQQLFDLQQARELLVDVVEGLIPRVNFNVALATSMDHRPFTPNDVEIIIRFESFYGYFTDSNFTGRIDLKNGSVTYSSFALYNSDRDPWHCKTEAYTLSRQLVTIDRSARFPYSNETCEGPEFRERYCGGPMPRPCECPPPKCRKFTGCLPTYPRDCNSNSNCLHMPVY